VTIAYDLRYACDHFVGIATYAHAVLDALLTLPGDERYVVLWDPRQRQSRFELSGLRSHPRVAWVEKPFAPLGLLAMARVGAWLRALGPAAYFSPFHLLPFRPACPCIVTIHDVRPLRYISELSPWRLAPYRWGLVRATRARVIVTVSEFSRQEVLAMLPAVPDRVRTVHPGVHQGLRRAEPRRPDGMPSREFGLVVGDNRPHKNLSVLARAWSRLGDPPPLELVAVGPTHGRYPGLTELARRSGARAVHLGRRTDAELAWLYANATIMLFPSLYEGFGSPLVEALQQGVPAVVSDIPAFREIADGAARFVPPHSPEAWAAEVRRLLADGDERVRLAAAGRRRAAELSYRRTAEGILAILRREVAAR
jgi:alpha-1,3-rhamnosyl/mannosyltransferase